LNGLTAVCLFRVAYLFERYHQLTASLPETPKKPRNIKNMEHDNDQGNSIQAKSADGKSYLTGYDEQPPYSKFNKNR
jgi:hypothetical protein